MTSPLIHAGLSDMGRVRRENQDKWLADPRLGLYLVTDGMGGAAAGELASHVVVQALPSVLRTAMRRCRDLSRSKAQERLRAALVEVSNALRARSWGLPGLDGMGATVVLALIRKQQALIAHMGDSRCYLLRGGKLECLTKDHTLLQWLIESGDMRPEEAATHPGRGGLTCYVGMPRKALPDVRFLETLPGDRLLLCSDGLTGMVDESEITAILARQRGPTDACQCLVAAANDGGGRDNITVLVVGPCAGDEAFAETT